jgi:peroxiredoxin
MGKLGKYRTLIFGVLSPLLAAMLGMGTYIMLTRASQDRDADFVFRLSMTAVAMALPFTLTLVLALSDRARSNFSTSSKVGLAIAALSLAMLYMPINGAVSRARQAANLALDGVPAPEMDTVDLDGKSHRLSDYRGQVVLLNIWATWCAPCRKEMPELDQLYKERASEGLIVLGLSVEDPELQRRFAEDLAVSYPLLTNEGQIPETFSTTARYPSNFLIDRQGQLRRAPSTDEPFENLVRAVEELLQQPGS